MARWMKTVNEVRFDMDKAIKYYFVGNVVYVDFPTFDGNDVADLIIQKLSNNAECRAAMEWLDKQMEANGSGPGVTEIPNFDTNK